MRAIALCMGLLTGAANYALLAQGCKRLPGSAGRAIPWLLGGMAAPVAGLAVCALAFPGLLIWFGAAAGCVLTLLAAARMLILLKRK